MSWPGFLEWKRPWVYSYTGSHMHRNSTSFLESNPKISLCFEEDLERDFRIWIFVFETRSLVYQAASLCSGECLELLFLPSIAQVQGIQLCAPHLWGVDDVLSECVLLTWAQPCQRPQCLRPIGVGSLPRWGSEKWQSLLLVQVPVFINDCPVCAKTRNHSFILLDDCSLGLLPPETSYWDELNLPPCSDHEPTSLLGYIL